MQSPVATRWIGGPAWDGFFFWGYSAIASLAGLAMVLHPALVIPIWWIWVAFIDGPHLVATYLRTYLDPEERSRHRQLYLGAFLWFLPGLLAWGAMELTGRREPFDLFLLFASLWAFHHATRQHYGVLAVYQRLAGTPSLQRRLNWHFIHEVPWGMYLLFLFAHPWSRRALQLPIEMTAPEHWLARGAALILALAIGGYLGLIGVQAAKRLPLRPSLFALFPVVAMLAFGFLVVAPFEPIVPHPIDPEQFFLAVGFIGGSVHGVQYLGMLLIADRRRYSRTPAQTVAARLGRVPLLGYVACAFASCTIYVLMNLLRGNAPGSWLAPGNPLAQLVLAIYWGTFFHHYYLDQKMWHPQYDPDLQLDLGLREAA